MFSLPGVRTGLLAVVLLAPAAPASAAEVSKYVPNNSDTIVSVNVQQVLDAAVVKRALPVLAERYGLELVEAYWADSPVGKKLLKEHRAALEKFFKDGDRIRRQLESFKKDWTFVTLAGNTSGTDDEIAVIFEGAVDEEKLATLIKALSEAAGDNLKVTKSGAPALYQLQPVGEETSYFLAVPEKGVLVVTPSKNYAQEALAKAAGKKEAKRSDELETVLKKVDRTQAIWLAGLDADEEVTIHGGVSFGDALIGEMIVTAKSAEAAKEHEEDINVELRDLGELIGHYAASHKEVMPLVEYFKTVSAKAKGRQVTIRVELSVALLDKVLGGK